MREGRTVRDILVLQGLSKSYRSIFRKIPAVQDLSVGIPRGEVTRVSFWLFPPVNLCHSECWSACGVLRVSGTTAYTV